MTKEEIMKIIEEDVRVDIYGDLYGHDRAAESLAYQFMCLEVEIERLKKANSDMGWRLNPDRMCKLSTGGQFTQEELNRGNEWR